MGKWKILAAGLALLLGASGTAVRAESVDYPQAMVKLICDLKAYSAEKKPTMNHHSELIVYANKL